MKFSVRTIKLGAGLLLLALFFVTGFGLVSLRWLKTQYSMRQFMPLNHPLYTSDTEIKKKFRLIEEQPILVTIELLDSEKGTWLSPERLDLVKQATKFVAGIPQIERALSITTFETAMVQGEELKVGNLFSLWPQTEWQKRVDEDALLKPGFLSLDSRTTMITGEIKFVPTEVAGELIKSIRQDLVRIFPPDHYRIAVSGVVSLQADMTILVGKEMKNFLAFAFLTCLLTLMAYFRSFSSVIVCLILVMVSNIGALSWMALSGYSFSVLSTSVPILASITALAIGSHTLLNFSADFAAKAVNRTLEEKIRILNSTYRALLLPNLLMAITTVIGFFTLSSSKIPLIREFAWSVAGGILISWLLITLILPPLLLFFPVPIVRKWTAKKAGWIIPILKYRFWILGFLVFSVIGLGLRGLPLQWSVHLHDDLPRYREIKQSADVIDQKMGGMLPLEVMIELQNETSPWNDPDRLAKLNEVLSTARKLPGVGSAIGYSDFFKFMESKNKSRQSVAEANFLYSMSGAKDPLRQFLSADGNSVRLNLRLQDVLSDEMRDTVEKVGKLVHDNFPTAVVKMGGMATMAHQLNAELSRTMIMGLWESLLWISLLIIFAFRSFRLAVVAAIPNLLAPLALLAAMSVLKTPIKPIVGVIFSIALGVAYNNTVYLVARLRDLNNNVAQAWYEEGNPCLFSSVALLGGFAVFMTSYFSINKTFGAYMLWSITNGLLGDLIVFPILLSIFPWLLNDSKIFGALEVAVRYLLRVVLPKRQRSESI